MATDAGDRGRGTGDGATADRRPPTAGGPHPDPLRPGEGSRPPGTEPVPGPRPPAADFERLLAAALVARERAWAPYSNWFRVGAAVVGESGATYAGCNVENASFGLTICAERVAVVTAIAAGERRIVAAAVVADTPEPVAPCGACRQVLAEFASAAMPILLANARGQTERATLGQLLPGAFRFSPPEPAP